MSSFPPSPFLGQPSACSAPQSPIHPSNPLGESDRQGAACEPGARPTKGTQHRISHSRPLSSVRTKGASRALRRLLPGSQSPSQQWGRHLLLTLHEPVQAAFSPAPEQGCLTSQAVVIRMTNPQEATRAEAGHSLHFLSSKSTFHPKTHHKTDWLTQHR